MIFQQQHTFKLHVVLWMAILLSGSLFSQKAADEEELLEYKKLYEIGEYERVLSLIQSKDHEVNFDLLKLTGNVFHKMGAYENAVQAYSRALNLKSDPEILVQRAASYLDLGILDLSLDDLNEAKRKIPNSPYLYYTLGNYSLDMGDMKNALRNFKKSIELNPDEDRAYFMMAVTYNEMGDYKKSIELFEGLTNKFPQAKFNIAVSYLQNKQPEVARELFDDLETVYSDNIDFFFFRAESKYFEKDKAGACVDYKRAADLGDDEASQIYTNYCVHNLKKDKSKRIDSGAVKF